MKKIIYSFSALAAICFFSCSSDTSKKDDTQNNSSAELTDTAKKKPQPNPYENATIEVRAYNNDTAKVKQGEPKYSGWGYDIYINGARTIVQPNAPALPGNAGFKTEADAKKVGELMAYKIKHNIMPPMISVTELDSLGVMNK